MTKWFEMLGFDILEEMAFGGSFHCSENGEYCVSLLYWMARKPFRCSAKGGSAIAS